MSRRIKCSKKIVISLFFLLSVFIRMDGLKALDYHFWDLKDIDRIMIVAHPDDETIWGGAHLLKEKYLVVCITCGTNTKRVKEIERVLKETGDALIMLHYPDKVLGKRSSWEKEYPFIQREIEDILSQKKWKEIVTHNEKGEYGHQHHIMTHDIVTSTAKKIKQTGNLYYFGTYYSKKKIGLAKNSIEEKLLEKKWELIKMFSSQSFVQTRFDHMFPYENFQKYEVKNEEI